ncbi:MAG: hypothetical protein IH907_01250 [Proteobacteria bacterium]|nr:hypothetical protein [Pseudomonadota bacterium]
MNAIANPRIMDLARKTAFFIHCLFIKSMPVRGFIDLYQVLHGDASSAIDSQCIMRRQKKPGLYKSACGQSKIQKSQVPKKRELHA